MMASVGESSASGSIMTEERDEDIDLDEIPVLPEGDEGLHVIRNGGMTIGERLWDFKRWSSLQLHCSQQYILELMGKTGRTVDIQLTDRVGKMRVVRAVYIKLLQQAVRMRANFKAMSETQRELSYLLNEMSLANSKIPTGLHGTMKLTSVANMHIASREQLLIAALESFIHNIKTLIQVAIDDLLAQIPAYKAMRIEYDAYRNDLEYVKEATKGAAVEHRRRVVGQAEEAFRPRQERFGAMRREFLVRVRFLEQNEAAVVRKQLVLLQNAMCAFYTGEAGTLHECLKKFHIKAPKVLHDPATSKLAAAEEHPLALIPYVPQQKGNGSSDSSAAQTPSISPLPE
ncbi:arfaptin-1-like [Sycon ciliatum]|uniref:arfaptin-1-like n=1 Tax=Sycon ciliatum TaxID=27933 RepID=UPI0031F70E5F